MIPSEYRTGSAFVEIQTRQRTRSTSSPICIIHYSRRACEVQKISSRSHINHSPCFESKP